MQIETLAAKYPQNPLWYFTKIHSMIQEGEAFVAPELNQSFIKSGTGFTRIPNEEASIMFDLGYGRLQAQRHLEQRNFLRTR
jgi:hypothetical protein